MGGGSKGGGSQTTTTNSQPWSGAQPYLQQGFHDLQQIYQYGHPTGPTQYGAGSVSTPDYYPGSTVAPMSNYTQAAINAQAQRAANGSPLVDAAQRQLTDTMQGQYLNANSNPYLQSAINYATAPVEAAVNSAFSSAGRYGSDSQVDALARGIGDISSNMAFQNYNNERDRQNQGMLYAPQLAQQDYYDINQLGASGSALDAYNQALIDSDVQRYNYGQDADWNRTMQFLSAVNGTPWGSSSSTNLPRQNAFSSALGTGSSILGMLGMTGAFGPAGWLSDERAKTDIERVGTLDNGLPVYRFRYKNGGPPMIGLLAQEVEKTRPDAVHEIDGVKYVDYARAVE